MRQLIRLVCKLRANTAGQDLIEYALLAAFVAVAAGAIFPNVMTSISTIFSTVSSEMDAS
jgi:Flp pilus assembly pilin Flp